MVSRLTLLSLITIFVSSCVSKQEHLVSENNVKKSTTDIPAIQSENQAPQMMKDLNVDYCMGKFQPSDHEDFIIIDPKYADRPDMYMRKEAFAAFLKMYEAASKENIKFVIRSAARNFDYQRGIWENKWSGKTKLSDGTNVATDIASPRDKALKILEYSSMPGTSRHHWGTDIDINSFDNNYFAAGEGKKLYDWMLSHAHEYGYCQPYTAKNANRPDGYNEEKWHWSYTPISGPLTSFARDKLKNEMISGFDGSETAVEIDVVGKYVLGINRACMHAGENKKSE